MEVQQELVEVEVPQINLQLSIDEMAGAAQSYTLEQVKPVGSLAIKNGLFTIGTKTGSLFNEQDVFIATTPRYHRLGYKMYRLLQRFLVTIRGLRPLFGERSFAYSIGCGLKAYPDDQ